MVGWWGGGVVVVVKRWWLLRGHTVSQGPVQTFRRNASSNPQGNLMHGIVFPTAKSNISYEGCIDSNGK